MFKISGKPRKHLLAQTQQILEKGVEYVKN